MNNYNADQIQTLNFRDAVRTKLGMYLNADKEKAILLGIRELIYNSQDEYEMGYGSIIDIDINTKDNRITVKDDCRGIPCGTRADGTNSLIAACTLSHTGGKMDDKVYAGVVGINGLGLKIVCLTAKEFYIEVHRDGYKYFVSFDDGIQKGELVSKKLTQKDFPHGTLISYSPNSELYENKKINIDELRKILTELSYFAKGLTFNLKVDDNKVETFISKNGLADALDKENRIHTNLLSYSTISDEVKVEFALHWVKKGAKLKSFANNLEVKDGGAFMTGFKTSLTKAFNKLAGTNFSGETIRKYLDGYVAVKVKTPQFSNQAKTELANAEARTATSKAITEAITIFAQTNQKDFEKIVELLQKETKAEAAAEKARNSIFNAQKVVAEANKKKTVLAGKLVDCRLHDSSSELIICEGKSAGGSIGSSRDSNYIAYLPLRGKIINALKNTTEDVMDNEEVRDLLVALGCGMEGTYNEKRLRYGKIVIMADADYDGMDIMCLVLSFFYRYIPQLITGGYIYHAKTPLYRLAVGKKYYYAYNDEELAKLQSTYGKGIITRAKGLGEMSPEDFKNTIFSDNGQYVQFTMEDAKSADKYFNMLLGKEIEERRDFIFENIDFASLEE